MKIDRNVFIYVIKDSKEKVRYVGQTSKGKSRFSGHINKRNRKQPSSCFIKKCVDNNIDFSFEIIEYCPIDKLDAREIFYIKYYRKSKCKLLNLTDGGKSTRGYKHSENTKKLLSELNKGKESAFKGRKHTDENIKRQSILASKRKGELNPFFNKKHTQKSKDEMSKTRKKMFKEGVIEPPKSRPFVCLENEKTYKTSREAALDLNVPASSIRSVLQGKSKSLYGKYRFIYKEYYEKP